MLNSIKLVVNVFNICYSENREILKRSRTLREYSRFMKNEGFEEGKAEGLAEGKAEMAKAMKSEGIDINTIVKVSGLSEADIEKL